MITENFRDYSRNQMGMASFLTKELLNEIGIDAIGDIMAILYCAKRSETVVSIYKYYLSRFLLHPLVISESVVPFSGIAQIKSLGNIYTIL